jgi:hypothetical protein
VGRSKLLILGVILEALILIVFINGCANSNQKASTSPSYPSFNSELDYIANKNSLKFHYPDCKWVREMKESNKWYYHGTRDSLIEIGYVPCKVCKP